MCQSPIIQFENRLLPLEALDSREELDPHIIVNPTYPDTVLMGQVSDIYQR